MAAIILILVVVFAAFVVGVVSTLVKVAVRGTLQENSRSIGRICTSKRWVWGIARGEQDDVAQHFAKQDFGYGGAGTRYMLVTRLTRPPVDGTMPHDYDAFGGPAAGESRGNHAAAGAAPRAHCAHPSTGGAPAGSRRAIAEPAESDRVAQTPPYDAHGRHRARA